VGPALDAYLAHDRVHVAADPDAVREAISRDYLSARSSAGTPYDVVVLAARRTDAAALNDRIRVDLRAAGLLAAGGIVLDATASHASTQTATSSSSPVTTIGTGCSTAPGRFERLSRRAGLPRIKLHELRHTSASIGLASGETLNPKGGPGVPQLVGSFGLDR
jgi:hypothetical protein